MRYYLPAVELIYISRLCVHYLIELSLAEIIQFSVPPRSKYWDKWGEVLSTNDKHI